MTCKCDTTCIEMKYGTEKKINDVQITYDTIVNKEMCKRARNKARQLLRGTYESYYNKLRSYVTYLRIMDNAGRFELKTYLDCKDRPIFQKGIHRFLNPKVWVWVLCLGIIGEAWS